MCQGTVRSGWIPEGRDEGDGKPVSGQEEEAEARTTLGLAALWSGFVFNLVQWET